MKEEQDVIQISDDEDNHMINQVVKTNVQPTLAKGREEFDIQYALERENNTTAEDKQAILVTRLKKYFEYGKYIEPGNQYFCKKNQPDYTKADFEMIGNELIIFGIDFTKKKIIRQQYKPKEILFINLSNWRMVYQNYEEAWAAINANCKDGSSLVSKIQSEDPVIPRGWFEMKPYLYHNVEVHTFVRFATNSEFVVEPQNEQKIKVYNNSKQIFTEQAENKKQLQMLEILYREKQKMERQERFKQRNSNKLYSNFEKRSGEQWEIGMNQNKGAIKENNRNKSRSRSRDNRQKKEGQNADLQEISNRDEVQSNYSFLLGKSSKDAKQLNQALQNLNFDAKSIKSSVNELNLSFNMVPQGEIVQRALNKDATASYQWAGNQPQQSVPKSGYGWSYTQYMQQKQRVQQQQIQKSKRRVQVISID